MLSLIQIKNLNKKHIVIDILPRLLWVIQIATLFFYYDLTDENLKLTTYFSVLIIGIIFLITGIIYLIWVFYFLAKPIITKKLVIVGPYKYVRHPMYVAIYVILIGLGLTFFSKAWFIILLIFVPLWFLNCKLEESQMIDLHGEKYLNYKKQVGMFFPYNFK